MGRHRGRLRRHSRAREVTSARGFSGTGGIGWTRAARACDAVERGIRAHRASFAAREHWTARDEREQRREDVASLFRRICTYCRGSYRTWQRFARLPTRGGTRRGVHQRLANLGERCERQRAFLPPQRAQLR